MSEENVISKKENDKNGSGTTTTTTKTTVVTKTLVLGLPRSTEGVTINSYGENNEIKERLQELSDISDDLFKKLKNVAVEKEPDKSTLVYPKNCRTPYEYS